MKYIKILAQTRDVTAAVEVNALGLEPTAVIELLQNAQLAISKSEL
jgi:hypothetical protein